MKVPTSGCSSSASTWPRAQPRSATSICRVAPPGCPGRSTPADSRLDYLVMLREVAASAASCEAVPMFDPKLEILPAAQRALWADLTQVPQEFVLCGGTAIAVQMGCRPGRPGGNDGRGCAATRRGQGLNRSGRALAGRHRIANGSRPGTRSSGAPRRVVQGAGRRAVDAGSFRGCWHSRRRIQGGEWRLRVQRMR